MKIEVQYGTAEHMGAEQIAPGIVSQGVLYMGGGDE